MKRQDRNPRAKGADFCTSPCPSLVKGQILRERELDQTNFPEREVAIFRIWFFRNERFLVVFRKKQGSFPHTTRALPKPPSAGRPPRAHSLRKAERPGGVVGLALWPGTAQGSPGGRRRTHGHHQLVPRTLSPPERSGCHVLCSDRSRNQQPVHTEGITGVGPPERGYN